MAGKRRGMSKDSGTRSGLLWEVERLLSDMKERDVLPSTLLMENVDAITYKTNKRDFEQWIAALADMGYTSSYKILNASDYGIPQNRNRCFMISRLDGMYFRFPERRPSDIRLKDILERDVPERFYLSDRAVVGLITHKERHDSAGDGFGFRITDPERERASALKASCGWKNTDTFLACSRVSDTAIERGLGLTAQDRHGIMIRNNTSQGYIEARNGDGVILDQPDSETKRGRVQGGRSPTVMTSGQVGTVDKMRIRRLTPRECWRLMGFTDDDFDRVKKIRTSDAQLYKQAGNSICVGVLVAIFDELYNTKQRIKQPTLMEFEKAII
jgi:DNA (cytosine-5)-methyltransferase 1